MVESSLVGHSQFIFSSFYSVLQLFQLLLNPLETQVKAFVTYPRSL